MKLLVPLDDEANPHSAMQAVTTAIGVRHGFESSLFAMALCFSLIVMYDAAGVRRHAGAQAQVLNTVVQVQPYPATKATSALQQQPGIIALHCMS